MDTEIANMPFEVSYRRSGFISRRWNVGLETRPTMQGYSTIYGILAFSNSLRGTPWSRHVIPVGWMCRYKMEEPQQKPSDSIASIPSPFVIGRFHPFFSDVTPHSQDGETFWNYCFSGLAMRVLNSFPAYPSLNHHRPVCESFQTLLTWHMKGNSLSTCGNPFSEVKTMNPPIPKDAVFHLRCSILFLGIIFLILNLGVSFTESWGNPGDQQRCPALAEYSGRSG